MLLDRVRRDSAAVVALVLDGSERLGEHIVARARGPVDLEGGEDGAVHADRVVVDGAAYDALDQRGMVELEGQALAHTGVIGTGAGGSHRPPGELEPAMWYEL